MLKAGRSKVGSGKGQRTPHALVSWTLQVYRDLTARREDTVKPMISEPEVISAHPYLCHVQIQLTYIPSPHSCCQIKIVPVATIY
jgi:hypothetical protein